MESIYFMMNPIIETFQIHNRINLYLIEAIEENHFQDSLTSKGRNVIEQFSHIHNVRLMWIKSANPALLEGLEKIEKENSPSKEMLKIHLEKSGQIIEKVIEEGIETGKIKGFKPHPTAFLGYLISHESHHRGQIVLALKQSGHPISQKIGFGLWEWGVR